MARRTTRARTTRTGGAPARRATRTDYARLVIDALVVLVGIGIVVRGLVGHHGGVYVAIGVVFLAFGLWRLRQWAGPITASRQAGRESSTTRRG